MSELERTARLPAIDLKVRQYEPSRRWAARGELSGPGRPAATGARGRRRPRRRLGGGVARPHQPRVAFRAAAGRVRPTRRCAGRSRRQRQRRAVAAQPARVLAPLRQWCSSSAQKRGVWFEQPRVADLVPDHVVEDLLGREQQAPVEAHRPVGWTSSPAGALGADRKGAVAQAGLGAGGVEARGDLVLGRAPVPALERVGRVPVGHEQGVAAPVHARAARLGHQLEIDAQVRRRAGRRRHGAAGGGQRTAAALDPRRELADSRGGPRARPRAGAARPRRRRRARRSRARAGRARSGGSCSPSSGGYGPYKTRSVRSDGSRAMIVPPRSRVSRRYSTASAETRKPRESRGSRADRPRSARPRPCRPPRPARPRGRSTSRTGARRRGA